MQDFVIGNLDEVQESQGFEPLPRGEYPLMAVSMELKDTSTGGKRIAVEWDVTGGQYAGRKIFGGFNIVNANPDAVKIALEHIKAYLAACGLPSTGNLNLSQVFQLEGKPFLGKVKISIDKTGQYDPSNDVVGFKPLEGASGPAGAVPAVHQGAPAQAVSAPHYGAPAQSAPLVTSHQAAPAPSFGGGDVPPFMQGN